MRRNRLRRRGRPGVRSGGVLGAILCVVLAGAAPAQRNWNAVVAGTAEGTHLLGNPDADLRLTQFVSYTCPHCASFEQQADGPLRLTLIASGNGAIEVRPYVRDPVDMTVALLTHCGPPAKFFVNHSTFLRRQATWIGPLQNPSAAQRARWFSGAFARRTRAIARDFRFYQIMATRGYTASQVDTCLADEPLARRLAEATRRARDDLGIAGTPSFAINGVVVADSHDWPSLRRHLQARLETGSGA